MASPKDYNKDDIKQVECRFAFNTADPVTGTDFHLVKEAVLLNDGRIIPKIRFIENYKRPFWVVKKGGRNFKEFKERMKLEDLDRFDTTQNELINSVAKALGKPYFRGGLKDLCKEPYVFGCDITSTAIIKHEYNSKAKEVTPYSNAAYDTETDVVHGTGEVIINTISFGDQIFTAVQASFVKGFSNPIVEIHKLIDRYIGEHLKPRNAKVTIVICENEIETIKACIAKAHEWKPDFLSVWSIEFDMDKIVAACKKAGIDPADIMNDPSVPKEFKYFKFKKGKANKTMASGRLLSFNPSQRWHSVDSPASFYWIDAMQVYRQVRNGAAEEPSYALDALLTKHKMPTKLKFKDLEDKKIGADGTLRWHYDMQSLYPLHYIVYNIFDCVAMEMLDENIKDLQLSMPMFAGCSDFANFNSLPRKAMNDLHWFNLNEGYVVGATSSDMVAEVDEDTTGVKGWIVMLQAHLIADNGLKVIEELPDVPTNIRSHAADLDVAGAYPTNEAVLNISKETTRCELIAIATQDGHQLQEEEVRRQTINLSGGITNSIEFCEKMFGMPAMADLLIHFDAERNNLPSPKPVSYKSRFVNWLSGARQSEHA